MRRLLLLLVTLAGLPLTLTSLALMGPACGSGGGGGSGKGGGKGGGSGGGTGVGFTVMALDPDKPYTIDPHADPDTYLAIAVDPANERVGVAYFMPDGTRMTAPGDGGVMTDHTNYALKYVEYNKGVVSTPEKIRIMQRLEGLSVAFEPISGDPVVAYLGGSDHFIQGESIFWFQHEAVFARRSGGTWTQTIVAEDSGDVPGGNNVSDLGFLVGLWPSVLFDSDGKLYFTYRDCHQGEFPQQDWGGSDVELWSGTPGGLSGTMLVAGGKDKQGYGGHLQLVMGETQPGLSFDLLPVTPDGPGRNVYFMERLANGTWSDAQSIYGTPDTGWGPSLAFDPTEGFGVAIGAGSTLSYINRNPQTKQWSSSVQTIYGAGSGGWYPSLAMDPVYHEPAIAFYICHPSKQDVAASDCPNAQNELRVSQKKAGNWQADVVDPEGGFSPKLGFFNSGKRFVVYRHPKALDQSTGLPINENVGVLKIAVEQ